MATRELGGEIKVREPQVATSFTEEDERLVRRLMNPPDARELFDRIVNDRIPSMVRNGDLTPEEADELLRYLLSLITERQVAETLYEMVPTLRGNGYETRGNFFRRRHHLTHVLNP